MTEEEKYEIAALATEVSQKRDCYLAYSAMNTPSDPIEREKSSARYAIIITEYLEAEFRLSAAQARIAHKIQ